MAWQETGRSELTQQEGVFHAPKLYLYHALRRALRTDEVGGDRIPFYSPCL